MNFLFPKPEVVQKKPQSAFREYLAEHHSELVLASFLLGAYATIKVLLLQHDLDRIVNDADRTPQHRDEE